MNKFVMPYAPLYGQIGVNPYRSGGYVKTIGSTTDTLGKLVRKGSKKARKNKY